MSKINEAVQQAVKNAENLKQGNTTVKVTEKVDRQVISVFLHGNLIAEFIQYYTEGEDHGRSLVLQHYNWKTATTKARLNAILDLFDLPRIHQSKGEWVQGDEPFGNYVIYSWKPNKNLSTLRG